MKVAHLLEPAEERVVFRDGLGVRERRETNAGEVVEWFHLDPAFAAVEHPLRERVTRLTKLQHAKFSRILGLEAAAQGRGPILVSSHVAGTRLSEVLEMAGHGLVAFEPGAGLQITREVLAALAVLHDSRNVAHGALAPERVVVTAPGRIVMVEHVLSHALDRLQRQRHQLWRDWRIPTPPAAGPVRLDMQTDLAQAGLLSLAALLGRPLTEEEYPHRLRGLLPLVQERLARSPAASIGGDVVAWLERLAPVDSRRAFKTVREAQHAFEGLVSGGAAALGISPARVKGVITAVSAILAKPAHAPAVAAAPDAAVPVVQRRPAPPSALTPPASPAPQEPPADSDSAVDSDIDIEALLRLEAELEGGLSTPEPVVPPSRPAAAARTAPPLTVSASGREPAPIAAAVDDEHALEALAQERIDLERQFAELVATVAPADDGPAHLVPETPPTSEPLVDARVLWSSMPAVDLVDAIEAPLDEVAPFRLPDDALETAPPSGAATAAIATAAPAEDPSPIVFEPLVVPLVVDDQPSAAIEHVPTAWWKEALPWRADDHGTEVASSFFETAGAEQAAVGGAAGVAEPSADVAAATPLTGASAEVVATAAEDFGYLHFGAGESCSDAAEPVGSAIAVETGDEVITGHEPVARASWAEESVSTEPALHAAPDGEQGSDHTPHAVPVDGPAEIDVLLDVPADDALDAVSRMTEPSDAETSTALPDEAMATSEAPQPVEFVASADGVDTAGDIAPPEHSAEGATGHPLDLAAPDDIGNPLGAATIDVVSEQGDAEVAEVVGVAQDAVTLVQAEAFAAEALAAQPLESEVLETEVLEIGALQNEALEIETLEVDVALIRAEAASTADADTRVAVPAPDAVETGAVAALDDVEVAESIEVAETAGALADVPAHVDARDGTIADAVVVEPCPGDVVQALAAEPGQESGPTSSMADPRDAESVQTVQDAPSAGAVAAEEEAAHPVVNLADVVAPVETATAGAYRLFADFTPFGQRDELDVAESAGSGSPFDLPQVDAGSMTAASSLLSRAPRGDEAPDWRHAFLGTPSSEVPTQSSLSEPVAESLTAGPMAGVSASDLPLARTEVEPDQAGASEEGASDSRADDATGQEDHADPGSCVRTDGIAVEDDIAAPQVTATDATPGSAATEVERQLVAPVLEAEFPGDPTLYEPALAADRSDPEPFVLVPPVADVAEEPVSATVEVIEDASHQPTINDLSEPADLFGQTDSGTVEARTPQAATPRVRDVPHPVPEVVVVDEGADGDVWNELPSERPVAGEAADVIAAVATPGALADPAPSAKRKKKRSRRKKPTQPVAASPRPMIAVGTPASAPGTQVVSDVPPETRQASLAEAAEVDERPIQAVRASLLERAVPTWTPPADLTAPRFAARFARPSHVGDSDVRQASSGQAEANGAGVDPPASPVHPRIAPAAISAPTTIAPDVPVSPAQSWGGASAVSANDAYRPLEQEIRAVGMPDLEEFSSRSGRTTLTSMADPISHAHASASTSRAVPVETRVTIGSAAPARGVNWRRLVAASLLIALFQGGAFAAWWWVQPGARGTLVVQTSKTGVEVLLDDKVVGRTPFREEVTPGRHKLGLRQGTNVREMPVEISVGVVTTQAIDWPSLSGGRGNLQVTSNPAGAEVFVNGKSRGDAPLLLEDLPAGDQVLMLKSDAGTVTVTTTVVPDETTPVEVKIFAGWILVDAPVEVNLLLNGRDKIGSSMDGQILLPPGTHRVQAVNEGLGIRQWFSVTVEPGAVRRVPFDVAPATLTLAEEAEVIIDGASAGTTPGTITIQPGTHDIVIRPVGGAERRQALTVRSRQRVEF